MVNLLLWIIGVLALTAIAILTKKYWLPRFQLNRLTATLGVIVLAVVCFLPIVFDLTSGTSPNNYTEETMIKTRILDYDNMANVDEVIKGDVVEQSFICNYVTISSIAVYTQAYGRNNWGDLHAELIDKDKGNKVLRKWTVNMLSVPDNDYLKLDVDSPFSLDIQGHECAIRFSSEDSFSGNCITFVGCENQYVDGTLTVRGSDTGNDLVFTIAGFNGGYNLEKVRVWICLLLFMAEVLIFSKVLKIKDNDANN